jgi:predicted nucleic acid-binding protein
LIAYADTGFLVSLYGLDDHSAAATNLVKAKPVFLLTPLGEAEFTNAIELQVFRKQWTRRQAHLVRAEFEQHLAVGVFRVEPLGTEVWEKALSLSRRYSAKLGTRTLDLLHVAAARTLNPDVFFSFDERQRKLANAEHLRVLPA